MSWGELCNSVSREERHVMLETSFCHSGSAKNTQELIFQPRSQTLPNTIQHAYITRLLEEITAYRPATESVFTLTGHTEDHASKGPNSLSKLCFQRSPQPPNTSVKIIKHCIPKPFNARAFVCAGSGKPTSGSVSCRTPGKRKCENTWLHAHKFKYAHACTTHPWSIAPVLTVLSSRILTKSFSRNTPPRTQTYSISDLQYSPQTGLTQSDLMSLSLMYASSQTFPNKAESPFGMKPSIPIYRIFLIIKPNWDL